MRCRVLLERGAAATRTDVGFSFVDDYLNELRSAVMSMIRYGESGQDAEGFQPLACALVPRESRSACVCDVHA